MFDGEFFGGYKPPQKLVLRPIQQDIVNQLRESFGKAKRVILMAGTGFGKTILATHIIKSAKDKGKRCVFINDRISLVNQTSDVFQTYGVNHGVIMSDHPQYFPDRQVQVASAQTLARRDVSNFDMIIIDECHTWYRSHEKILNANPDAYVLGLSATPFSKGLGKHFDFHIEPYRVRQLIDQGLLCDFEIYGPEIYDLNGVKTTGGDYNNKALAERTDKAHLVADVVQTYQKLAKGRKSICFCTNVAHGRHLVREFNRHRISAVEVNAYQSPEESKENMRRFIEGEVDVICSVEILIKGFDLTSVDCVIWATATKSPIKWIQGCGRGLRIHPGKTLCRIIDHGGNCERIGFPDEFDFVKLDDGKHKDSKSKNKERPEQKPKKCPSCDFLKAPGVQKCPACGFKPEFAQDVEVQEGELKKLQRKDCKDYSVEEKQAFLGGLNAFYISKGKKPNNNGIIGASLYAYQDKFGKQPPPGTDWRATAAVTDEIEKFVKYRAIKFAKSKHKKEAQTPKTKPESLHGKLIRLDAPCKYCGSDRGMLYPKGPHTGVDCAVCTKWLQWINPDEARRRLF